MVSDRYLYWSIKMLPESRNSASSTAVKQFAHRFLGYVHTVPDRFLLRFKSCSGTVWTRVNVLLRCRNCSEAFPVWTEALSVIQFATIPVDLKDHLPKRGSVTISAPIKVFRLDSERFKNLSDTERSTLNSGTEQYCSGAENASKAAFLVWTEALSGTLSGTLRFTIQYSVNIALNIYCSGRQGSELFFIW